MWQWIGGGLCPNSSSVTEKKTNYQFIKCTKETDVFERKNGIDPKQKCLKMHLLEKSRPCQIIFLQGRCRIVRVKETVHNRSEVYEIFAVI